MSIEPAPYRLQRNMRFFLERVDFGRSIRLNMASQPDEEGTRHVARSIAFERVTEDSAGVGDPLLTLNITAAQQLMDELWHCGLRPTDGTGSAGSLAATERHLKDMQAIAVGLLRKDGVEVKP